MSGNTPGVSPSFDAYDAKLKAMKAIETQVMPDNKAALFEALAAAGIHTVVVSFDGAGDSGQMESIDGFDVDRDLVQLPEAKIDFKRVTFESPSVINEQVTPREIVETMAYAFLEATHDGWEIDDGAYGEFTFGVAERLITLDYNERFTESTNHQHEF